MSNQFVATPYQLTIENVNKYYSLFYEDRQSKFRYRRAQLNHKLYQAKRKQQQPSEKGKEKQSSVSKDIRIVQKLLKLLEKEKKLNIFTINTYIIKLYKNDKNVIQKLKDIMNINFQHQKLYLYGGSLRDRYFDNVHGERTKIQDYDFLLSEQIFDEFVEKLEQNGFQDIITKELETGLQPKFSILYAKLVVDKGQNFYKVNFKTFSEQDSIDQDYKNKDFTVNNLTYDVIDDKIIIDKYTNQSIQDIYEKKINLINSFERTFINQEIRFLRGLSLIGKGYTLPNKTAMFLRKRSFDRFFDFDMTKNHMQKYMQRIMRSNKLDQIFYCIRFFKIERLFFKLNDQEFLKFRKCILHHNKTMELQLSQLQKFKEEFFCKDYSILKSIIGFVQQSLIPLVYIYYNYRVDGIFDFCIFSQLSYRLGSKRDLSTEKQTQINTLFEFVIQYTIQNQDIRKQYDSENILPLPFVLLSVVLLMDKNAEELNLNIYQRLKEEFDIVKNIEENENIVQKEWDFLVDYI